MSETSTCVYSVVVTDKSFCGLKGFSKVPDHSHDNNNAISLNSASDLNHESWYLEISPYGPYLRCAIYCVDEAHEGPGSGLNFHKFQTKLYVEDDEANAAHKAVKYKKHVVKKIGRQALRGPGVVDLIENEQPGGFALSLQGSFRGSVQQFTVKGHVQ